MQKDESKRLSRRRVANMTLTYAATATLWLILSTPMVNSFPQHPVLFGALRIALFIFTGGVLIWIWTRQEWKLRQSQYQYMLYNLLEPVFIHDHGTILDCNEHCVKFFEVADKQELIGKSIFEFVNPTYRQLVRDRLTRLYQGEATEPSVQIWSTLKGSIRHVEILAIPITYHGRPAVQALFHDITALKMHEATLFESEQRLRTVINAIPDMICLVDPTGKWIEANDALLELTGLPKDGYRGKPAKELADLCNPEFARDFISNADYEQRTYPSTTRFVYERDLPDGNLHAADITRVPVTTQAGIPNGLVVVARDTSAERKMIRKLEQSEQRYRQLIESSIDAVFVVAHYQIEFVNQAAVRLTGAVSKNDLLGQPIQCFLDVRSHVIQGEFKFRTLDQHSIDVEAYRSAIDFNGEKADLLVIRDITERKQADEVVNRSEKLATAGKLAAGLAHEIRNPLTSLLGFLQLMKQDARESNQHYLDIMSSELQRIETIVNEFLVLAKTTVMQMNPAPMGNLVSETIALLTAESDLRSVRLNASIDPDVPLVLCDRNRMKQVLVNLIKNALEAVSEHGTVDVRVTAGADQSVEITITDNGVGIPEDQLARLGEPFFTTKPTGTGLGLMVTHKIIESHGGRLHMQSQVGKGTEVRIVLPVAHTDVPAVL